MSQDLVVHQGPQAGSPAPFGPQGRALAAMGTANIGAVAIEQERAIAEAQGQMTLAKRFPRDLNSAHAELMVACKSAAFAAVAFYAKPQGGGTVSGPSIRMAEQIAQVFGNFQYGHRELSRDNKFQSTPAIADGRTASHIEPCCQTTFPGSFANLLMKTMCAYRC